MYRELSAKLTEGLFYKMFGIISYVIQIRNVSFTTPPSKIIDFCHLPLHRGGFGWFFDKLKCLIGSEQTDKAFGFVE